MFNINLFHRKKHKTKEENFICSNLSKNIAYLRNNFKSSSDVVYRNIKYLDTDMNVIYIDNMANEKIINEEILQSLMLNTDKKTSMTTSSLLDTIKKYYLSASQVEVYNTFEEIISEILSGNTILLINGCKEALSIESKGYEKRSVTEPKSEQTIRGPREGFVELLKTNVTLIRRRIKNAHLGVDMLKVGKRTKTDIALIYLDNIVNTNLLNDLRNRIQSINTDGIIGSAQIEQLIEQNKWTIFPQTLATERVDKAADKILEGRIVVIVDGTPFVLIIPSTFAMFLNSTDDSYERSIISSVTRILRYINYFLSTSLPALYIAVIAYHPGMLPTQLALSITGSRVGLPLPTFFEILIMEFTLEALTEASIRLPKPMGQTVGIVGGLVIGQASVQAGLVTPVLIIITALTAICTFATPVYSFLLGIRTVRIPLILSASLLGLYGVIITWIFILIHLSSLKNFEVRYLGDYSPYKFSSIKDTIFKFPKSMIKYRPEILHTQDEVRQEKKGGSK